MGVRPWSGHKRGMISGEAVREEKHRKNEKILEACFVALGGTGQDWASLGGNLCEPCDLFRFGNLLNFLGSCDLLMFC